jgi:hypothetical protein
MSPNERAGLKTAQLLITPLQGETKIQIELFREFVVLSGQERPEIDYGIHIHVLTCFKARSMAINSACRCFVVFTG